MYTLNGRECFYYILRHWKRIIVIALVFALLLGAYKAGKEMIHWKENKTNQEQAALNYEHDYAYVASLSDIYSLQIEAKQNELAALKDFSMNSNLADSDAGNIYRAEAELFFDSTLPDGSYYPVGIDILENFQKELDISTNWEEVASVGNTDASTVRSMFVSTIDSESTCIDLVLYGFDYQSCLDMMDSILANCASIEGGFEDVYIGLHMSTSSQTCSIASTSEINEMYSSVIDRISTCEEEIASLQDQANTLPYPQAPSKLPYIVQVIIKIAKYTALGAAAGVISSIVLLYLLFYLNGNIHSEEEYEYYVNSFVLAMWKGGTPHRGISHLIAVKENHGLIYDRVETVDRLLANIVSSDPSVSRVVFTASDADEELDSIREYVKNSNHTIKNFVFAPDILRDTEALSALEQGSVVVLLEYIDKCPISVLKKEVEQIKVSGSRIIGAIILR